jgi:hypothetical protein
MWETFPGKTLSSARVDSVGIKNGGVGRRGRVRACDGESGRAALVLPGILEGRDGLALDGNECR